MRLSDLDLAVKALVTRPEQPLAPDRAGSASASSGCTDKEHQWTWRPRQPGAKGWRGRPHRPSRGDCCDCGERTW